MAVASTSKEKNETSLDSSFPSSPLASKPGSDAGSDTSSVGNSGISEPSERSSEQFESPVHQRKDVEVQSPGYLRSEEYRLLFRLPSDEILVQDFNCAFQESILLQGHMYLFVRHICFYSNIFGFETKKVIPLNEITCVRKAKTAAIFPNAIEIASGAKKHFFASFLSRDEAYRVIVDRWCQHSNGISGLIDRQDSKSEIIIQDHEFVTTERVQGFNSPSVHLSPDERDKDVHSEEHYIIPNGKDDVSAPARISEAQENCEDSRPVGNVECLSSIQPLRWKLEDGDPPKVPEYFTKVAESKFPIQAEEFFNLFFSDAATNFIEMFHKRCGDKDLSCSSWYDHEEIGYARDISFQHPIKIYFGAKFGHCQEVQKYRVYRNSHLVIETSQEVGDVPYADYFRVQGLWDVEEDGNGTKRSCSLRVYVNVAFSKKTMWKGKIEQNTIEECRDAYALWLDDAHKLLKQKNLEKLEGTGSTTQAIQNNDSLSEENVLLVTPSERINETTNLPSFSAVASDSNDLSPRLESRGRRDHGDANSTAYLIRELFERICLYMKSRNHLPLVLGVAFITILLLMQLSIIVLLTRTPQVHVVSQMDYMNGIGSSRGDKAEAVAWLEKRIHHLKDEMLMVETRLEKMQREHMLLKSHLKGLEQLNN